MAKRTVSPKRGASRTSPPPSKSLPSWVGLALGLVGGAAVMYFLQLNHKPAEGDGQTAEKAPKVLEKPAVAGGKPPKYEFYTLLPDSETIVPQESGEANPATAASGAPTTPPVAAAPAAPTPQAPSKPVTADEAAKIDRARAEAALSGKMPPPPPQVTRKPTPPPPPPVASSVPANALYYLQAGSFRRPEDANAVRARLAMLGQQVRVESGTVRDETWYRVLVGPFNDRAKLGEAQKKLQSNGFSSLLFQQYKKS